MRTIDSKGRSGSASLPVIILGDVITLFLTPAGTVLRTRAQIVADNLLVPCPQWAVESLLESLKVPGITTP